MKKIISLIIIAAMIFATLPVFAEADPKVTIAYVKDGETYTAGSTVILGAKIDTDTEVAVKRVDFYANGIKIPGCITSLEDTLSWTIPTSGSYEIYAQLTTTADGAPYTSKPVTVYGVASEEEMVFGFDSVSDVTSHAYANWGASDLTSGDVSSEYVKKSKYSAICRDIASKSVFEIRNINADRTGDTYINYLIYSTQDLTIWSRLTGDNGSGTINIRPKSESMNGGFISLKKGWNPLSIEIAKTDMDGYYAVEAVIKTIQKIEFSTAHNATIPTGYGFVNEGIKIQDQPNLAATTLYFDSAWLSTEPIAAPKAVSSIPTGATKVCNGLDKMTFTFDKEMELSALSDGDVTVTDENGAAVDNFTLVPSTNALVVDFGENALSFDKTYTVTLSENIKDFYGKSVDSSTREFTFSTINSGCEGVEPIASFTYPAANATVASDNVTLAAKVIFGGNVSKVEFFDENDNSLGAGTQGADGEWYLALADGALLAGTHTVKAVVTYGDDNATKVTNGASFEVVEALSYSFTGISAGEEITLNTTAQPLVSRTVGITPAVGVSKVVYKLNGDVKATVTEAPFTWDMPITAVNTDVTLSADVYSVGVNVATPVTYKAIYVDVAAGRKECTNDFESKAYDPNSKVYKDDIVVGTELTAAADIFETLSNRSNAYKISYIDSATYGRSGKALMIDRYENKTPSNNGLLVVYGTAVSTKTDTTLATSNHRIRLAVDFYIPEGTVCTADDVIMVVCKQGINDANINVANLKDFETGKWHNAEVFVDTASKLVTKNINGISTVEPISDAMYKLFDDVADGDQYKKLALRFNTWSDLIIDNLSGGRVTASGRTDLFVNGIKKDTAASGETVNVSVANLSSNPASVSVIFALYDDNNELVAVWTKENVNVGANEFSQTTQNVPYTVNGKTGTTVKAFCWNNMNAITPIKSIR